MIDETIDFTAEEIEALADLLDWAHNEAISKMIQYRMVAEQPETNTTACVGVEMVWSQRAEAIRKLKAQHPVLDTEAE